MTNRAASSVMPPNPPPKAIGFGWVPKGMDPSTACRVAIRVPAYVEQRADGKDDYHVTANIMRVLDKDTICWIDFHSMLASEIVHGRDQELHVTYFDKNRQEIIRIESDSGLLEAFSVYWDSRRLPLSVEVIDTGPRSVNYSEVDSVISIQLSQILSLVNQEISGGPTDLNGLNNVQGAENNGEIEAEDNGEIEGEDNGEIEAEDNGEIEAEDNGEIEAEDNAFVLQKGDMDWGEADEIEYVGVDDEKDKYKDIMSDDEMGDQEYYPDSDPEDVDPLAVDDERGCESVVHITDIDNPKIAKGVTFEDGYCFKRCIRQYAVLNEVELAVPYSESTRFRAYCKAKRCKWRIYAAQCQDGRTWQIRKLPYKHNCASTSKYERNSMATNHWVKDRVINWLRSDPTIGAKVLKQKLEERFCIKISYYVVWDGRRMALDEILGGWKESFLHVFSWKAEIEKRSPGSIVEVDWNVVGDKQRFSRLFVALKSCIDGFLNGCRPYLGVDSTVLTGKWKGQLAAAIGIDGHNWMYPVAYGVFESETKENWEWFMQQLHRAIGSPHGLVISTDAGKGIDKAVTRVFTNVVEHRECMRHLVKNFQKRFRGEVFERNLWPASRCYRKTTHDRHYNEMDKACPKAMIWIKDNHKQLWARSMFSTVSKCDYVTNNIAETFNSWIRHEKSLPVVDLVDKIRQMIMERVCTRMSLASKLTGKVLPHVMKDLHARSRNLRYTIHKSGPMTGEVGGVNKDLVPWRFIVDLDKKECSCRHWQMTGLPCVHAIAFIGSRRMDLEDFVDNYYSVVKFKAAYASAIPPMPDKDEWEKVDMGFTLLPPLLKRAAGRPRTRRLIGVEEGGTTNKRRCKRCGGFGHLQKTCNETVADQDAPPPAPPKKRRTYKPKVVEIIEVPVEPSKEQTTKAKGKRGKKAKIVPVIVLDISGGQTSQVTRSLGPVTRSRSTLQVTGSPGTSQATTSPGVATRSKRSLMDTLLGSPPAKNKKN